MSKIVSVSNLETQGGQRMYFEIMKDLAQTVEVFILDNGKYPLDDAYGVIAAVELLATMAEHYNFVLGIDDEQIQKCREIYIRVLSEAMDFDPEVDASGWAYERYQVIQGVFDRAGTIVRKHKEGHH